MLPAVLILLSAASLSMFISLRWFPLVPLVPSWGEKSFSNGSPFPFPVVRGSSWCSDDIVIDWDGK
jgi:hypothetical protein